MRRELLNLAAFIFIVGMLTMYLGLDIMALGQEFVGIDSIYRNEIAVMGDLWSFMGGVLAFLGILCFPVGIGVAAVREWGRKNGVVTMFLISALCLITGLMLAYVDIKESVFPFALTVMALICMQSLRERRTFFELDTGSRRRYDAAPSYRDIEEAQKRVGKPSRHGYSSPANEAAQTVKCRRCGTVNMGNKSNCMKCGKEL